MDPRLQRVLALTRRHIPGLRLVDKRRVPWMRVLGRVVRPWAPDFDTHYTTVLGRSVYLPRAPEEVPTEVLAATLCHELVHQIDQRRWGPLFYASYGWMLPTGRTMRAYWERRAYAVDLLIAFERGGAPAVHQTADRLAELFSGPSYLYMWAGRESAASFLRPTVEAVLDGSLVRIAPYAEILDAWRGSGPSPRQECLNEDG